LAWLDALRGIAVLAVVYEHLRSALLPDVHQVTDPWVRAGVFGVTLFFLVSGYIIPASLERHGSLRDFWLSRLFRLYPAYLVAIGLALAAGVVGLGWLPTGAGDQPVTTMTAHLTMLHELVGGGNIQRQFWTLSYEMVFYLAVSALFVAGLHRYSAQAAVALAGAAALGGGLPARALSDGRAAVAALAALALVTGLAAITLGRRRTAIAGAALLVGLIVVLLAGNQRSGGWEGFLILAVMFTGTSVYRARHGQAPWSHAALAAGAVLAAALVSVASRDEFLVLADDPDLPIERSWVGALLLAGTVFGVGVWRRRPAVPRWLAWLGTVSYSVYLLHALVIDVTRHVLRAYRDAPLLPRAAVLALFLAVLLGVSYVSYRAVELPTQRLGRTVIRAARRRGQRNDCRRTQIGSGSAAECTTSQPARR
jgi:peptidoglycan/LPS O-acetylase OafA/YrhL